MLFGGAGNDALIGEGGDDVLDGGAGDDFLYGDWANWQSQAYADPAAKTGNDTLYGGAGNDQLMGNGGDDALEGGSGNDKLYGDNPEDSSVVSLGDDVLDGGAGDDYLYAGAGNDTLTGGSGDDYLGGGAGDDTYIFSAGSGVDTLEDAEGATTLRLAAAPIKTVLAGDSETVIYFIGRWQSPHTPCRLHGAKHCAYLCGRRESSTAAVGGGPQRLGHRPHAGQSNLYPVQHLCGQRGAVRRHGRELFWYLVTVGNPTMVIWMCSCGVEMGTALPKPTILRRLSILLCRQRLWQQ